MVGTTARGRKESSGLRAGARRGQRIFSARYLNFDTFRPESITVATPVIARETMRTIAQVADAVEYVAIPEPFYGVGAHYEDFSQTSDDEVRRLLAEGGARDGPAPLSYAGQA